ncbi:hypothetical protein GLOTRDRAFT_141260, partial [Gloeophyllum trabeum ATCC 11539]
MPRWTSWRSLPETLKHRRRRKDRDNPRLPLEEAKVLLGIVGALADGAVIGLPCLKSVCSIADAVITICQDIKTNKDDAAKLAGDTEQIKVLLKAAMRDEMDDNVSNEMLKDDVERLHHVLECVYSRMKKLSESGRMSRLWKHQSDKEKILECRRDLGHAMQLCQLMGVVKICASWDKQHRVAASVSDSDSLTQDTQKAPSSQNLLRLPGFISFDTQAGVDKDGLVCFGVTLRASYKVFFGLDQ